MGILLETVYHGLLRLYMRDQGFRSTIFEYISQFGGFNRCPIEYHKNPPSLHDTVDRNNCFDRLTKVDDHPITSSDSAVH